MPMSKMLLPQAMPEERAKVRAERNRGRTGEEQTLKWNFSLFLLFLLYVFSLTLLVLLFTIICSALHFDDDRWRRKKPKNRRAKSDKLFKIFSVVCCSFVELTEKGKRVEERERES